MKSLLMVVAGLALAVANGIPLNPSYTPEAVRGYKEKAEAGDAEAQYLYSRALLNGTGEAKDPVSGFVYAKKAVDQGCERALRPLGMCYENGWGVETNVAKAEECYTKFVSWARIASERGDVDAQWTLGFCYEFGNGVKKDAKEAVKWYRSAAELGSAEGQ